jgi:hypothetical protein
LRHPRGPRHQNRYLFGNLYPSLDFSRLQGLAMCSSRNRVPTFSRGFSSLTAPSSPSRATGIPAPALPVPRFSQPPDGLRSHDLRVCSTPLALRGFDLQSLTTIQSTPVPGLWLPRRCPPLRGSLPTTCPPSSAALPGAVTRPGHHIVGLLAALQQPAPLSGFDRPRSFPPGS